MDVSAESQSVRDHARFAAMLLVAGALFAFGFCVGRQSQSDRLIDVISRPLAPAAAEASADAGPANRFASASPTTPSPDRAAR
jgi:hypothetical protein